MEDHIGLKFTPAIVCTIEMDGLILYQNAASMAAFGMQVGHTTLHIVEGNFFAHLDTATASCHYCTCT